jgi:predicted ribosomally synthesized peptide with SipW-like signal peptide
MESKKKQSAKQKKILVASILLAGLIAAGGTFAWYTSKDEVTNKLSAANNYNVSVLEAFTPPFDWVPGQNVNKDVAVVNTGNYDAFVKVNLSNSLDLTTSTGTGTASATAYSASDVTKYVQLSAKEVTSIQAGGRLVYTYGTTGTAVTGEDSIKDGTGFTPTTTGLYIFERDSDVVNTTDADKNPITIRQYDYSGYYFVKGTAAVSGSTATPDVYYKINNISVTKTDGAITAVTYKMVKTDTNLGKDMTLDYTYANAYQAVTGDETTNPNKLGNVVIATYHPGGTTETTHTNDIKIYIYLVSGWENNWTLDKDTGTFYYKNTLKAGEESAQLVDSLTLDKDVSEDAYSQFDYNLKVTAESIQVVREENSDGVVVDTATAVNGDASWLYAAKITYGDGSTTGATDKAASVAWAQKS